MEIPDGINDLLNSNDLTNYKLAAIWYGEDNLLNYIIDKYIESTKKVGDNSIAWFKFSTRLYNVRDGSGENSKIFFKLITDIRVTDYFGWHGSSNTSGNDNAISFITQTYKIILNQ